MAEDVRIYRPAKTAMQSGQSNTKRWVLEFEPTDRQSADPLMGWAGSHDTKRQVRLWFEDKDAALSFARKKGWTARVDEPKTRKPKPKSYADNFAYDRIK